MSAALFPILCPSATKLTPTGEEFVSEPCNGNRCTWWADGGCSAHLTVTDEYRDHLGQPITPCPVQGHCRWHLEASGRGEPGCAVQQLGMICEHQGGEWNTFEMASADEW